ncbi:1243_t:CDS:2, partial [Acaulospora colombiana]
QSDIEASRVFIFTPKEEKYRLSEEREHLTLDAWLLKFGQRGRTARLLNQTSGLVGATFGGPFDVSGTKGESDLVSSERIPALYLAAIGQGLGALELGRWKSLQLRLFSATTWKKSMSMQSFKSLGVSLCKQLSPSLPLGGEHPPAVPRLTSASPLVRHRSSKPNEKKTSTLCRDYGRHIWNANRLI